MVDLDALEVLKRIISQQKTTVEIDAHFMADKRQRRMEEEGLEGLLQGGQRYPQDPHLSKAPT